MRRFTAVFLGCGLLLAACSGGDDAGAPARGGSTGPAQTGVSTTSSTATTGSSSTTDSTTTSATSATTGASTTGGASTSGAGGSGGGEDASADGAGGNAPGANDGGTIQTVDGSIPRPPGMVSIFDGKSLAGWDGNPKMWSIKDGAIDGLTQNGGQLIVTVADYDNFRIVGSARMPQSTNHLGVCFWGGRGGWNYNGCIDFVPPSGSIWDYGGLNGIRTYPYVWMGMPVLKTDWHQFEILANLTTGVVRMGVDGHEFPIYKDTTLNKRKKGPIGLQIHAGFSEVQYKDLAVEVSPKEDRLLTTTGPPTEPK